MKTHKQHLFLLFLWQLFLIVPVIAATLLLPVRPGQEYTIRFDRILYPFANFDGVHYLRIAAQGYSTNLRFFPLFPLLINLLSHFGLSISFAGLILSRLFFILGISTLANLIRKDYGLRATRQIILFLLLFPTAFFLISIYSEGLFLLLTAGSFYLARKNHWFLACLVGLLLSATRLVGIAILPALLVEYFFQKRKVRFLELIQFAIVPLGLIGYMIYNKIYFGDYLLFFKSQGDLGNGRSVSAIISPLQTLFRYFKILVTIPFQHYEWSIALFEVGCFFLALTLLYAAYKKRVRLSYLVFTTLVLLPPVLSGTFSGLPRYLLVAFPLFIPLGLVGNKKLVLFLLLASAVGLYLCLMAFSRGFYIA